MCNKDIREEIKKNNVKHWQIADVLGLHESVLSRKLRNELSDSEKANILSAINLLKAGAKND